jgi:hypothetical protein
MVLCSWRRPRFIDELVNAAGALYEMLCDDVTWAGFAESELDFTSWDAYRVYAANLLLAPLIDQQRDLSSQLEDILQYHDGWMRRGLVGNLIELGYWKTGYTTAEINALPIIGSDDLTAEPTPEPTGYDDCVTEVIVNYCDRDQYFHKIPSAPWKNPGLRKILLEDRQALLDRPHITKSESAQLYGQNYGQQRGRPGMKCTLQVKLNRIEAIEDAAGHRIIGQVVRVDSASLNVEVAYRVWSCDYAADSDGSCTLQVVNERSIWPTFFQQPPPGRIGNFKVIVPAIVNYKAFELPAGLKKTTGIELFVLAQRPGRLVSGFKLWHSFDDAAFYENNPPMVFGAYGVLTVAYPNTTADLDQTVGMTVELFGVDLIPDSNGHILDYTVLCFCDNEIMSCGLQTALGSGVYKVWMYRGRYGTVKSTHAIGAKAFFILRANIFGAANKLFLPGDDAASKASKLHRSPDLRP